MEPRNVILWALLPVLVVLAMSAGAQAQELTEVPASEILEKIQAGEDVHLENVRITGELNVNKIELETVPIAWGEFEIEILSLKGEPKIIESKITIEDSIFENDVNLPKTQFIETLDLQGTSFSGKTDFRGASFGGYTNFGGVSFDGDAYFESASFGGDANFMSASFGGDANFESASFGGDAIFNSAEFNIVTFSNTTFTNVSLYGADFKRMDVDWRSLKDVLVFDGPTYIKLIKNFKEMEQFGNADDAYFQYRQLSRANEKWLIPKSGEIFMELSCGYGVRPWRALACGVIIIFIFGLIYMPDTLNFWPFTLFDWLRESGIRRLKESDEDDKQNVSFCDAFYFSVVTFTTVGYGDWYPKDRYRKFVMIEGLLGWLTLALFLVTLANVMIRL